MVRSGKFQMFNFGSDDANIAHYGQVNINLAVIHQYPRMTDRVALLIFIPSFVFIFTGFWAGVYIFQEWGKRCHLKEKDVHCKRKSRRQCLKTKRRPL